MKEVHSKVSDATQKRLKTESREQNRGIISQSTNLKIFWISK